MPSATAKIRPADAATTAPEVARPLACIDAAAIGRALPFAAKNDVRWYLDGIYIRPGNTGPLIVATNGHILYAEDDPTGHADREMILAIDSRAAPFLKAGNKIEVHAAAQPWPQCLVTITHKGNVVYVAPQMRAIEGKYPDVEALFRAAKEYRSGLIGTFDPAYLERIYALKKRGVASIRFFSRADEDDYPAAMFACKIEGNASIKACGLINPRRDMGNVSPLYYMPAALRPKPRAAAPANPAATERSHA